jgi:hypothetical protein
LKNGKGRDVEWTGGNAVLAELGSLQVEFRYLASVSGDEKFATKVNKVFETCSKVQTTDGLLPIYLSPQTAQTRSRKITFGALGDSYYEYLLKVWIQGGKVETKLRDMYDKAIDGTLPADGFFTRNDVAGSTSRTSLTGERLPFDDSGPVANDALRRHGAQAFEPLVAVEPGLRRGH